MTIHARAIEKFARTDRVRCHVVVSLDPASAFEKFRHDVARWWPREYTYSGEAMEDFFLEGRKGGVMWERGPEGFRIDIARVMRWMPPEKMILRWHIAPNHSPEPDPAHASEVEIRFESNGSGGTRIELEHRNFSNHGTGSDEYSSRMASDTGWSFILKRFAEHCGGDLASDKPALRSVTTVH